MDKPVLLMTNCSYPTCVASGRSFILIGGLTLKKCGGCKETRYCSEDCQRGHWPEHKKFCKISKNFRLLVEISNTDSVLNSYIQKIATEKSNVEGVGERRAVGFNFPDEPTLNKFVEQRDFGMNSTVVVHHLSPDTCQKWVDSGDKSRGFEECLSVEATTLKMVQEYDVTKEAVLILTLTKNGTVMARSTRVKFL